MALELQVFTGNCQWLLNRKIVVNVKPPGQELCTLRAPSEAARCREATVKQKRRAPGPIFGSPAAGAPVRRECAAPPRRHWLVGDGWAARRDPRAIGACFMRRVL